MSKVDINAAELARHFVYLDNLRASGITNMWAAPEFLVEVRGLKKDKARDVFLLWRETYNTYQPAITRATEAATYELEDFA